MIPAEARTPLPPEVAAPAGAAREQVDDLVRPFARRGAGDPSAAPPWSPETRRRLLESLRRSRSASRAGTPR